MAVITLGQLRDLWQKVADWTQGTGAPKVTVDNEPTVHVGSMPNVTIESLPNVNVGNIPNVRVIEEPNVKVVDYIYDAWNGNANTSRSFYTPCRKITISNDGTSDLTLLVGNIQILVKSTESFEAQFEPFSSIQITTTSAYRCYVSR